MLTIRQFCYFEALAETLHFGRAAKRLNISQPALSAQIAQMEAFFEGTLFERRPDGLRMTAEGRRVRERVRRILTEVRDLEALAGGEGLPAGRLTLGLIASVAPYLLPTLLPALGTAYPGLAVAVRESTTAILLESLSGGELDCVVLALPVDAPGVRTIRICEDRFHLAVPESERARIASPVRPAALGRERLILLEEGHCLRDQALKICGIAQPADLASLGATSLATLLRMVAGGLGVTLVPESAIATEARGGGIAFLPFADPAPYRTLALAFRASSGRIRDFEALAEIVRSCGPPDAEGSSAGLQLRRRAPAPGQAAPPG